MRNKPDYKIKRHIIGDLQISLPPLPSSWTLRRSTVHDLATFNTYLIVNVIEGLTFELELIDIIDFATVTSDSTLSMVSVATKSQALSLSFMPAVQEKVGPVWLALTISRNLLLQHVVAR